MDFKGKILKCFPQWKRKALVMSYDDGSEHDRKLIDIFSKYGIRGTFNLNSAHLGTKEGIISREEVRILYQGHEIACHTMTHPNLLSLPDDAIRLEVSEDKEVLEELAGYTIRGLAYPFGNYNSRVTAIISELELGIEYARTINDTGNFEIPTKFLELSTTCHHNFAIEMGKKLLESDSPEIAVMIVWGHSYELDGWMSSDVSKNWNYINEFCRMMHDDGSIWFTTTIEIVDYIKALQRLELPTIDSGVSNPSPIPVWIRVDGAAIELPPGAQVDLRGSSSTPVATMWSSSPREFHPRTTRPSR